MSVLLDLMYASTVFEHSLFVATGCKGGKNFGESSNHGSVVL